MARRCDATRRTGARRVLSTAAFAQRSAHDAAAAGPGATPADVTVRLSRRQHQRAAGTGQCSPSTCRRSAEPLTLDELRRAGPLGGAMNAGATREDARVPPREAPAITPDRGARARQGQSRPAGARHPRRRLSRAADRVSDHRSARHADRAGEAGAVRAEVPHAGRAARRPEPRLACRRGAVESARPRRRSVPTPSSRSRKRSRCRRVWAAEARMRRRRCRCWRACGAARRSRCCARSRRASARMRRSFCPAGRRSGWAAAKRSIRWSIFPRHWVVVVRPPFGVSTVGGLLPGTTRIAPPACASRAASCRSCRCHGRRRAAQMINDLEPPVMRRHPEIGAIKAALREAGAVGRGDVGQRLGGLRAVPHPARPPRGRCGRSPSWPPRPSSAGRCRAPSTSSAPVRSCAAFDPTAFPRLHLSFSSGAPRTLVQVQVLSSGAWPSW